MGFSTTALQIAFMLRDERLGRRKLAERSGLGEMVVRLEVERLRDQGLIQLDRAGCRLTPKGIRRFGPLLNPVRRVIPVDLIELRMDGVHLAAHLIAHRAGFLDGPSAWTLRDAAIREGATGLISLSWSGTDWTFAHNAEPVRTLNPKDAERLAETFPEPGPEDSLLVAAASDPVSCSSGLWAVIRALYEKAG